MEMSRDYWEWQASSLVDISRLVKSVVVLFSLWLPLLAIAAEGEAAVVNPLGLAEYCIGKMAKFRSTRKESILAEVRANADSLLSSSYIDADGKFGWGYRRVLNEKTTKCGEPGSVDAFNDGTCNPPDTPYMIQTGYAISCLSQVAMATEDVRYLNAAIRAVEDSWKMGAAVDGCQDCWSYWYSYHKNDENRFVRNTNMIMGEGLAWLYAATGNEKYAKRSLQTANEEMFELKSSNYGYMGIGDVYFKNNPKLASDLIDNHIPHVVKALKDISIILNKPSIADYAKKYLDVFMSCNNKRCKEGGCTKWAVPAACKATMTAAPCILSDSAQAFVGPCIKAKEALGVFTPFQDYLSEDKATILEFSEKKTKAFRK